MGHYSHPSTPQGSVPHEDYGEISSPGWPRTPASPVSTFFFSFIKLFFHHYNKKRMCM